MKYKNPSTTFSDTAFFPQNITSVNDRSPDLYLATIGQFKGFGQYQRKYSIQYESIHIVEKGHVTVKLDNSVHELRKGDLLVIFRGQKIEALEDPDEHLSYIWIDLKGEILPDLYAELGIKRGHSLFRGNFDEIFAPLTKEIFGCYENDKLTPSQPIVYGWNIIDLLRRYISPASTKETLCEAAMRIIRKEFKHNLSLDELCSQLSVDRSTIFRKFKKKYSMSPKQYIDKLRIEYAEKLLEHTQFNVEEVALEAGFGSQQNFFTQFKKSSGMSPIQWRKEHS